MSKLFIVTGEHSGDIHASYVVRELKQLNSNLEIQAIGGKNLQKEGVKLFKDHSKMSGFGVNLKMIIEHMKLGKELVNYLVNDYKPDLVLLIDYGGFNLKIAQELKKEGIKVYYYVLPQIWNSRGWRINAIKKYVDKVLYTFPFEEELYKEGVDSLHVGHPLVSQILEPCDKQKFFAENGLDLDKKLVGIFPGSRKSEVKTLVPIFQKTAQLVEAEVNDIQFCIAQAPNLDDAYMQEQLKNFNVKILKNKNHELLSASDCLLLASGTVSLEAALYKTPMVIAYKVSLLFYIIYLMVRYLKWIALPNIVLRDEVVREFQQYEAQPKLISEELIAILTNEKRQKEISDSLVTLKEKLTDKVASKLVASEINKAL